MILAVDVHYRRTEAVAAGICFEDWEDEKPQKVIRSVVSEINDYEPGSFYKREMPCILNLIKDHDLKPNTIVIDGFVVLGESSRPGLGMHLYKAFGNKVSVIGVAKKPFKNTSEKTEVLRGKSLKPLYVTAVGVNLSDAKEYILSMHGKHRIPTLLKLVDHECKKS